MPAAIKTLNESSVRMAVTNQAHTVRGSRISNMPLVRERRVVTMKFKAPSKDDTQKIRMLTIQRSIPKPSPGGLGMALSAVYCDQPEMGAPPVTKKAETITKKESAVPQNESMLSRGKHISRAPIWSGKK